MAAEVDVANSGITSRTRLNPRRTGNPVRSDDGSLISGTCSPWTQMSSRMRSRSCPVSLFKTYRKSMVFPVTVASADRQSRLSNSRSNPADVSVVRQVTGMETGSHARLAGHSGDRLSLYNRRLSPADDRASSLSGKRPYTEPVDSSFLRMSTQRAGKPESFSVGLSDTLVILGYQKIEQLPLRIRLTA